MKTTNIVLLGMGAAIVYLLYKNKKTDTAATTTTQSNNRFGEPLELMQEKPDRIITKKPPIKISPQNFIPIRISLEDRMRPYPLPRLFAQPLNDDQKNNLFTEVYSGNTKTASLIKVQELGLLNEYFAWKEKLLGNDTIAIVQVPNPTNIANFVKG